MNLPKRCINRLLITQCLLTVLISGCSGSGDGSYDGSMIDQNDAQTNAFNEVQSNDAPDNAQANAQDNAQDQPAPSLNPVVPDPSVQNYTEVTFQITVPAYQSNQLRVELDWGDNNLNAQWIGDEYWTATANLPTGTLDLLTVTFYDFDGNIELARSSQDFTTGLNAAESLYIQADEFDANLFDDDEDGVNNLDELAAGTDPYVDEISLLPIIDSFNLSSWSRMSVSRHFESHLTVDRPDSRVLSTEPNAFPSLYTDVDIDAGGNGTLKYNYWGGSSTLNIAGTRTTSENSVTWEGTRRAKNDYGHGVSVKNTVTYIDANTRSFVEESEGSNIGAYSDTWETSSDLIGRLIEGTSLCEPIAGTFTVTNRSNRGPGDNYTITISKTVDDQYWRVGTGTNGYFVRELIMLRSYCGTSCGSYTEPDPSDKYFTCDFVDF